MSIPRKTVEAAAFWDKAFCLDCGEEQDRQPGNSETECVECEGPNVLPASLILACADFIESED